MPTSALPKNLTTPVLDKDGNEIGRKSKLHWDWPWPFSRIPRGWTAFAWDKPRLIAGRATCATFDYADGKRCEADGPMCHPKPISPAGAWQISRFPGAPWWAWPAIYISWSGKKGKDGTARNIRAGMRWDDVDNYVNWGWPISAAGGAVVGFLAYFFHPALLVLLPLAFGPSSRRFTGDDKQDTSTN